MENIEMTNMCMIEDLNRNEILVQNRCKGHWTGIAFPGGHVEQGEGLIDSTIREIKEETGLEISNLRLVGIKHWYFEQENKRYMVFLYTTNSYSGKLIAHGAEGEVIWVNKDAFYSLDLAKGMKETFEAINNPALSEERHYENADKTEFECVLQ